MEVLELLKADLCLIHLPAVFDFRNHRDIYFPFLGTSGDVPITPLYEYFPVGFRTLQQSLRNEGHEVEILNLCTILLMHPDLKIDTLFKSIDAKLFGASAENMLRIKEELP